MSRQSRAHVHATSGNCRYFRLGVRVYRYDRLRPIEDRDSAEPFLFTAIHIAHNFRQEPIRGLPNLMRCPVIDLERL